MPKITKNFLEEIGTTQENLDIDDFKFNSAKGYFEHSDGHLLSKVSYIAVCTLIELKHQYTLIPPKKGSEWCRCWF
jgi:hypothetical protein